MQQRLADRRITLSVTPAALEWLALTGFDPIYGARPLRRLVQSAIGDQLARALLAGEFARRRYRTRRPGSVQRQARGAQSLTAAERRAQRDYREARTSGAPSRDASAVWSSSWSCDSRSADDALAVVLDLAGLRLRRPAQQRPDDPSDVFGRPAGLGRVPRSRCGCGGSGCLRDAMHLRGWRRSALRRRDIRVRRPTARAALAVRPSAPPAPGRACRTDRADARRSRPAGRCRWRCGADCCARRSSPRPRATECLRCTRPARCVRGRELLR